MGNFNKSAELISTAETEQLIWNKTGAYVFPTAGARMEVVSSDAKDAIAGVGARTVRIDYLDSNYRERHEVVRLKDFATNKLAKGDMATVTAGTEWKNHGLHSSLNVGTGAAVFTPTAQYDGIKQDVGGATIAITSGKKYFIRALSKVASTTKQLAVQLFAGQLQVETATVIGTIEAAGAGDASVIVTSAYVAGSPLTTAVAVANNDTAAQVAGKIRTALGLVAAITAVFTVGGSDATVTLTNKLTRPNDTTLNIAIANGTCLGLTAAPTSVNTTAGINSIGTRQVETATVVGTITAGGKAKVTVSDINHIGSPLSVLVDVAGTKQVETATVLMDNGFVKTGGNAAVVVTCTGMTNTPKTIAVAVAGTKQEETATVVATITEPGYLKVTIDSIHHKGLQIDVPVADNDDADAVALAIRTKLATVTEITDYYAVSGATDKVILTSNLALANDASLNIAIADDTCVGVTAAPSSANTTAGVLRDNCFQVAAKIRAALLADADIAHPDTGFLTVGGTNDKVTLTAKSCVANVANLNISIADGTCDGITTATTSTNTTAGVAGDNANAIATKIRAALALYPRITDYYLIGGTNAEVNLTSILRNANDSTLNIAIANYTCTGITAAATSANTTAGVADVPASAITNFDAVTPTTDLVVAAVVTATADAASGVFAIMDTSTGSFVEITLDDIGMYELDTLGYQDKSLADLKLYFETYVLSVETVKRTFATDIFRINKAAVTSAGSELDNVGNISVKELTGGSDYVYAYIKAGEMISKQMLWTVPSGKYYCIDKIQASSLLNIGGKKSVIGIKTNYNRAGAVMNPVLALVNDYSFVIADNTVELESDLAYPEKSDIMMVVSGDAAANINVTVDGNMY